MRQITLILLLAVVGCNLSSALQSSLRPRFRIKPIKTNRCVEKAQYYASTLMKIDQRAIERVYSIIGTVLRDMVDDVPEILDKRMARNALGANMKSLNNSDSVASILRSLKWKSRSDVDATNCLKLLANNQEQNCDFVLDKYLLEPCSTYVTGMAELFEPDRCTAEDVMRDTRQKHQLFYTAFAHYNMCKILLGSQYELFKANLLKTIHDNPE